MKRAYLLIFICCLSVCCIFGSFTTKNNNDYKLLYKARIDSLSISIFDFTKLLSHKYYTATNTKSDVITSFTQIRYQLKSTDFWLRYVEAENYSIINGAIKTEWENEVFAKFKPAYKKEGFGIYLAEQELLKPNYSSSKVLELLNPTLIELEKLKSDSVLKLVNNPASFYKANRLFLLNLATIYTTGFECNNKNEIVNELQTILHSTQQIYQSFDNSYPEYSLSKKYNQIFDSTILLVDQSSKNYTQFNHYLFIKKYVNRLYAENAKQIILYKFFESKNLNDFSLNNNAYSIFDKHLFKAQNEKGIYQTITDSNLISEIKHVGKLLFYDPILSGNNQRSCASCHKPSIFFTDTITTTSAFNRSSKLVRNTPSLINVMHQQMLMLDGKHNTLHNQALDVITNPAEMNSELNAALQKIMSCKTYHSFFNKMKKYTARKKNISMEDVISALTFYYADASFYTSKFDDAINYKTTELDKKTIDGFNIFMSKAQCGTCHFVPIFNGVKAPFNNSEFEVIGVPADLTYTNISKDSGRFYNAPSPENIHSFRTPTLRNIASTKPYMHNGIFKTIDQVIEFYNSGGGIGKKMNIDNQTLSSDSLHLTTTEIDNLKTFIESLNENIPASNAPTELPLSKNKKLNTRKVSGVY
ncbi:MAG: putative cytochrome peroxidase [Bacteroidota bacterium]